MVSLIRIVQFTLILICLFIPLCIYYTNHSSSHINKYSKVYSFSNTRLSYFQLDEKGQLKLKNGEPYKGQKESYTFTSQFSPSNTSFIVIDPWIGPNNKIIDHLILPLISKASKAGFPVYIFTNNCIFTKKTPCPYQLNNKFNLLAKKIKKIHIIFWDSYNHKKFKELLKNQKISKLIYMGFASNMCVIGRPAGMIPMKIEGFSIYYIPEASAAIEFNSTEKTKQIHNTMTQIIASWLANIIQFNEIYNKL